MNEAFRVVWYKCIGNDANNKAIEVEAEDKIGIRIWGTQGLESQMQLSRELGLDK